MEKYFHLMILNCPFLIRIGANILNSRKRFLVFISGQVKSPLLACPCFIFYLIFSSFVIY